MIEFFVLGVPKPAGSKRVFLNKKTGKPIVTDASGQAGKDWRGDVKAAAQRAYQGPLLIGPIRLVVLFLMPRPKGHFGTGRNAGFVKTSAPPWHTIAPDATKLLRGLEDALAGIIYADDGQIVSQFVVKRYGNERSGARVKIIPIVDTVSATKGS